MTVSCLFFRMEPLLLKVQARRNDACDVERLPCSQRLFTGYYLHVRIVKILPLHRV